MPLIRRDPAPSSAPLREAENPARDLRAASADRRFAAARALSGRPEAIEALGGALRDESDAQVREAILTALARTGDPEAARAISPLIRSDEASVRTGALDALRLMPGAMAEHLPELLADDDADVRLLACEIARGMAAPLASRIIGDLLAREAEANVCAAALDVMAEVGGPEALPALALCRARFAEVPFLAFAIDVTRERIAAGAPGSR